jgi:hypothetical protein
MKQFFARHLLPNRLPKLRTVINLRIPVYYVMTPFSTGNRHADCFYIDWVMRPRTGRAQEAIKDRFHRSREAAGVLPIYKISLKVSRERRTKLQQFSPCNKKD